MEKKKLLKVKKSKLLYGKKYGVTFKQAKRAFISGMSKSFKKKVKVKFVR
jgi:hypothetical protein